MIELVFAAALAASPQVGERLPELGATPLAPTTVVERPRGQVWVVELIRSADWCLFCAAQLREWDRHLESLDTVGVSLTILTAEGPEITGPALARRGLSHLPVATVDPALWGLLELENPRNPELPRPTTFVLGPDGTIAWVRTTAAWSARTSVSRVLDAVEAVRRGAPLRVPVADGGEDSLPELGPKDVRLEAARLEVDQVQLTLRIPEGLHVYGRREKHGHPVSVEVDDREVFALVPGGRRTKQGKGLPASFWLEGEVEVTAYTYANAGTLRMQVCSASTCFPPVLRRWEIRAP